MDQRTVIAALVTLVVGVVVGLAIPRGGDEGPTAAEVASPSSTPTPPDTESTAPAAVASFPEPCAEAMAAAGDAVRFLPEALSRLRNAYESSASSEEGGAEGGPPPAATFSQLQSQAQSMTSRFIAAESECEAAVRR